MSTWSDDRLDKLSGRTDAGFKEVKGEIKDLRKEMHDGFEKVDQKFEKVDGEFKSVRQEMKEGFKEINQRFDRLNNILIITVVSGFITLLGGLLTAIFVNGVLG